MSGSFRHYITIESRTDAQDQYGDATPAYTTLAQVWAEIRAVSGRERWDSKQVEADVSHRIRCWWFSDLDGVSAKDRITTPAGRVFDIVAAMDRDGRSKQVDFLVLERK